MFHNILRHSVRSFKRQKSYLFINILGLSIGIACSILIALYVINEAGYDSFNTKKDRIYRLVLDGKIGGQEINAAWTSAVIGPTMVREIPEVEECMRMSGIGPTIVEYNNKTFTEDDIVEADSTFFNIFSIPVLKGDAGSLLNAPHLAVISESTARRIFGEENPVDKTIKIGDDTIRYTVSGIMADVPVNSHFNADILTSFMTNPRSQDPTWMNNSFSTYLLLKPNTDYKSVDSKIPGMLLKYVGPELERFMNITPDEFEKQGNRYGYYLQSLKDIHLDTSVDQEFKAASDPKYLIIFGCVAVLIILIASINFMNLSTAQSAKRAKEVGLKKIAGSTRGMLILQFLSESFILSFLSLLIALVIVILALPYLNSLLGLSLAFELTGRWYTIPVLLLFAVAVGTLSGSYPAFYLSSFSPYEVLKGEVKNSIKNGRLRQVLVVFQFAVSIMLIVGTLVIYRQISFMLNKDVGFNKEQLIVINRAEALGAGVKSFKQEVKNIPGVVNIASSTAVPGRNNNNNGYMMEGRKEESFLIMTSWIDYDFLETYGMTLAEGRNFNESYTTDKDACIINETALKDFNISDLETTRFIQPGDNGSFRYLQTIGAVKNFHFESLRNPIGPYIFRFKGDHNQWGYVSVRLAAGNYSKTISEIEKVWKEYTANDPMQYYFVDEDFDQMYRQEKQNAQMAVIFSILAIFVAALGLFGLISFTVEQRTKEIGVRKALGSSVAGIYLVISREIVILVSLSALFAWPVIYYITSRWLESFYYRINPGVMSFAAGLAIAVSVAVFTISFKILKAAAINPAQSLKYE